MDILLAIVYQNTVIIIGRWSSNSFLRYIQIQVRNLRKFISDIMSVNKALYTIPKEEAI